MVPGKKNKNEAVGNKMKKNEKGERKKKKRKRGRVNFLLIYMGGGIMIEMHNIYPSID